jgi:hypothetical protein
MHSIWLKSILDPKTAYRFTAQYAIGYTVLVTFIPWLVDVVLLLRVLVVYPPHTISRAKLAALIGPPILLKIARVAVFVTWAHRYLHHVGTHTHVSGVSEMEWSGLWGLDVAIWLLVSLDNGCAVNPSE